MNYYQRTHLKSEKTQAVTKVLTVTTFGRVGVMLLQMSGKVQFNSFSLFEISF